MVSEKQGVRSRFGPSTRILELARHKTSKTIWATTPRGKLSWGDQEPGGPVGAPALGAFPSARIQYLAEHKRRLSAGDGPGRKDEEAKTQRPSSKTSQYQSFVRLSAPRGRSHSSQEARSPHTPRCEINCPIWHVDPRVRTAAIAPRLLRLANPKQNHPDFQSNRESVSSPVSSASRGARVSQRLVQLSLPRLRKSNVCSELGRPEESVWTVSRAARRATPSSRVEMLATPKPLSKDYVAPREAEWRRNFVLFP
ncbi:uncharacterized protein LOC118112366 [Hippoglossus stenolepis]|uniref:uncharacterized protein LOC118112366 n=1 Tax=Hippoglossus stenolepis TaxID=195615 RepID=UPI001FAF4B7B|nr:uncharacterized protein LOC118112366 [Hippoglossus stenolepis]